MRLGISSYTYTWAVGVPGHAPPRPMGAVDLLERAAQLGVRLVQVADNLPLDRLSPEALDRLAQRAMDLGMAIEVGTRGIAPDHLLLYLELALRFGSPIVRVVVDTANCHPPEAEVVATLRPLMPAFERAGVCLAVENHDRFPARALARIIEQVDSPNVGICLDTANSFGALEGPEHVVRELGPWAVNLHVKGFVVQRARHMMGFTIEGRPVEQGQLDVPWLLQALHDLGRDPNAILEQWTSPEEDLAATIAKEAQWAAQSIAYLRRLIPE
jgi:sugar phosphate isomerase/epimerase